LQKLYQSDVQYRKLHVGKDCLQNHIRERAENFSSSDFARMEQGAEKKTENNVSKIPSIMQQTKRLELILPFFSPLFNNVYCLLENIKSISNLSCLEITNETTGCSFRWK
jgi:hypothetical protein